MSVRRVCLSVCPHVSHGLHSTYFREILYSRLFGNSYDKSQQDAQFLDFILVKNSTCFGQTYFPSSGVLILYSQQLVFVILETCRVLYQNKVEKQCIFLAVIIRIYHDARSSECQICSEIIENIHTVFG
jgi:hypothetical protein